MVIHSDLSQGVVNGYIRLRREEPCYSILVAGDLCPTGRPERILTADVNGHVFADITPYLRQSDLVIVNLECPLTCHSEPIQKAGPHLRADPRCSNAIRNAGFHVATLANNHIMDMGQRGLADTLEACQLAGLETVGAGSNLQEATRPLYLERNGLVVALLAFAEHEFSIATTKSAGAWPLDLVDNFSQIREAKQRADFVLVVLHGGHEFSSLPSPRIVKTCRWLVDIGANAVICHHTHAPSGMEVYRGAPIVYGVGNFLFDWPEAKPVSWYKGYLVSLGVTHFGDVGELRLTPYWQCHREPVMRRMSDSEATQFLKEIAAISVTIADEAALNQEWARICRSRRVQYLSAALSLTRVERRLVAAGIWPAWRLKRARIPELLNLFTCESHRDVVIAALQAELGAKT